MKFAGLWNVLAIRFPAPQPPSTLPSASSSHARPLPSARPAMKGAPGREGFPGILRMWRRLGMLGAVVALIVMVVAVFSTTPYLSISSRFTEIPRSRRLRRESCRRPSDGTSNWVDRLNSRAVCRDRGCRVRSGHYLRGEFMSECVL